MKHMMIAELVRTSYPGWTVQELLPWFLVATAILIISLAFRLILGGRNDRMTITGVIAFFASISVAMSGLKLVVLFVGG